ncbi:MAG TPA: AAA family ATPase [Burkholderiales bacterium]|nr:AAA family ATPase [Burkholderiales bacterium]
MKINTTLVVNPKGGSGKTTIAINLAASFAADNVPTTLMDYDPQGSSLNWLRSRSPQAPRIHGANGAPGRFGQLRSFEMYVPPQTQQLIIDAPAGSSGVLLQEMIDRAHCIVVPVVPSVIDIHATGNFIKDILATGRVRTGAIRLAVVANKVRVTMPAYQPLLRFLDSLEIKLRARLLDSDVYLKAAEAGLSIFEYEPAQTVAERKQFTPIVDWVSGEFARPVELAGSVHELPQIRRVSF